MFAALLFELAGCASSRPYRPAAPHRAEEPGLRAEIVEAREGGGLMVLALRLHGASGARVTRALLAPAAARPCFEGLRDRGLFLDGKRRWLRPLDVSGDHALTIAFPGGGAANLLWQTPVVDLLLEEREGDRAPRCLRLPLSGHAPELAWQRPLTWSAGAALRLAYPSHPLRSVSHSTTFDFSLGRWLGPVRARADAGAGVASCSGRCFGDDQGFAAFSLRGAIDGNLVDVPGFAFAAELAYEQLTAFQTKPDRSLRWETNRGPRIALRFDLTPAPAPGWPFGARQAAFGLELSLARRFAAGDSDSAFVWGLALVSSAGF